MYIIRSWWDTIFCFLCSNHCWRKGASRSQPLAGFQQGFIVDVWPDPRMSLSSHKRWAANGWINLREGGTSCNMFFVKEVYISFKMERSLNMRCRQEFSENEMTYYTSLSHFTHVNKLILNVNNINETFYFIWYIFFIK